MLKNPILLGVNIDHVATLREARKTPYPDLIQAARLALEGGADGITIHLREDRRHIQDKDVFAIRQHLPTRLNLEMACSEEILAIALQAKPDYCCFVPEKREELTTEGGLAVNYQRDVLCYASKRLQAEGILISFFIEPSLTDIEEAKTCGADIIELHTGCYANTHGEEQLHELEKIKIAATFAKDLGLIVNAGHGLNEENVAPIAAIAEITELNIGHSIVACAIDVGMKAAVQRMKTLMVQAREAAV